MDVLTRSIVCDRVRAQASLRLDGELSELESRMVDSHLARCHACTGYHDHLVAVTSAIREAPLEPLQRPILLRRSRRRVSLAGMPVGVAAALAVAVLGIVVQLGPGQSAPTVESPTKFATYEQLTREVKQVVANGRAFQKGAGSAIPL